jgi:UDP-glucose 4-epimerase
MVAMILITGGLGFIGRHTARGLLELGESCVLTRYRIDHDPEFLTDELGRRVFVEPVDLADRAALLDLGRRHRITGIVHLAESGLGVPDAAPVTAAPVTAAPVTAAPLLNVLHAAEVWGVGRVTVASAIGVYIGVTGPALREDSPLPLTATHPIELMKKTSELLSSYLAARVDFDVVTMRIGGIYGPLYRNLTSNLSVPARLVHPSVRGEAVGLTPQFQPHAGDGGDWCYAPDCGRAIALLQLAGPLTHRVYNVGTGHPTTNAEIAAAVRRAVPAARIDLPGGHDPHGPGYPVHLDTTRLREATGFEPAYDIEHGVADYVNWLTSGHDR